MSTAKSLTATPPCVAGNRVGQSLFNTAYWIPPLVLLVIGVCVMPFDVPVSRLLTHPDFPDELREIFDNVEPFGHGVGVVVVSLLVAVLDRNRGLGAWRVLAAGIGAGLLADLVKVFIGRTRPRDFDLLTGTVSQTWGDWLPFLSEGGNGHSFPSAHTTTAAALALILARMYPRGRAIFAALVALVACHRLQSGAHFLSDVCVGAALGWTFSLCCSHGPLGEWFTRLEASGRH